MPDRYQRTHPSSTPELGRINRRRILAEILYNAPLSRKGIADLSGLTGATVSRIVKDLVTSGLVTEASSSAPLKRSGRREIGLALSPNGVYFIGIGINAFTQWVSLFGPDHNVLAYKQLEFDSLSDPTPVLNTLIREAKTLISQTGISRHRIAGGAIAVAGVVDPATGHLLHAPTLGWDDLPLGELFSAELAMPICVETFPNTLNLAETRFGMARGCSNVVLVNVSLHLGASLLLDQQLRRGRNYGAGLIGDLTLTPDTTSPTLDTVAAGISVIEKMSDCVLSSGRSAAETLLQLRQAALNGDRQVNEAFYQAGKQLSHTLKIIDTLLQPDQILIAGPISSIPTYIDGAISDIPQDEDNAVISVSAMEHQQALRLLAYDEFLVRRDINLTTLNS